SDITSGNTKPKTTDGGLYIPPSPNDLIAIRGQQEAKEAINKILQSEKSTPASPVIQKGIDGRTEALVDKGEKQTTRQATQQGLKGTVEHKNFQEPTKPKAAHLLADNSGNAVAGNLKSENGKAPHTHEEQKTKSVESSKGFEVDDRKFAREKTTSNLKEKKPNPFLGSAFEEGIATAIEMSVVKLKKPKPESVSNTENVACISVKSRKISGYLIAALGKNKKVDFPFLSRVQKHLRDSLLTLGEVLENEIAFDFALEPLDFQNWVAKDADFLKTSFHQGDQLKMAFFPRKDMDPPVQKSISEKMFQLPLAEFAPNSKVLFDAFIYLPLNNKYILYTPKDKKLYAEQKNRLVEKNVEFMHLHKSDITNLKKYRAQVFLEEKHRAHLKTKAAVSTTTA
ncbi:MAG: hypothetical protein AB7O96_06985, partial [Pseudobdellovibrionaceae bacterium]